MIGFIIFFIEEFIDEKQEIKNLYNLNEKINIKNEDNTSNNNDVNNTINNSNKDTTNSKITKENALKIALNDANISQNDIHDIEVEIDYKYNQTVYEVSFNYQKYEYEYYINAENGNILKSFREID